MRSRMSDAEFEKLVEEALAQLPDEFRLQMENIAIVIEEEPEDDDLDEVDIGDDELLGIFRGIPLTEQSFSALPALPNQIAIFRGPILRICRSRREAVREIRETVIHELGHFFGLSDDEMPF
ncbi:MAG TPA: metallopeptidase family protein [Thermoanaerobaculia bacterium]|nr:metallopeptidase family protein [Thermoanaerobaculia bacterium]